MSEPLPEAKQAVEPLPCPFCGAEHEIIKETPTAYYVATCLRCDQSGKTKEEAISEWNKRSDTATAKARSEQRDGDWIDKMGACKVCDGEIPYGHTANCHIWKLEQETAKARKELAGEKQEVLNLTAELVLQEERAREELEQTRRERDAVNEDYHHLQVDHDKLWDETAKAREVNKLLADMNNLLIGKNAKAREELQIQSVAQEYWEKRAVTAEKELEQNKSAPTADVEKIVAEIRRIKLAFPMGDGRADRLEELAREVEAIRAPLVEALESWLTEANEAIEHCNKRQHLSLRDWCIKRETLCAVLALTGTGEVETLAGRTGKINNKKETSTNAR